MESTLAIILIASSFLLNLAALGLVAVVFGRHAKLAEHLAMLKGLHPHHVNHETWMPGGMSRDVYEEMKANTVPPPQEGTSVNPETREWAMEQTADAREFMEIMRSRGDREYEATQAAAAAESLDAAK